MRTKRLADAQRLGLRGGELLVRKGAARVKLDQLVDLVRCGVLWVGGWWRRLRGRRGSGLRLHLRLLCSALTVPIGDGPNGSVSCYWSAA